MREALRLFQMTATTVPDDDEGTGSDCRTQSAGDVKARKRQAIRRSEHVEEAVKWLDLVENRGQPLAPSESPPFTEIALSEALLQQEPQRVAALLLRIICTPLAAASLRVLDLSYNDLDDALWTSPEWLPLSSAAHWTALTSINLSNNRQSLGNVGQAYCLRWKCL